MSMRILKRNTSVKLFENDVYKKPISIFTGKYYVVADYSSEYTFKIFKVVNIINGTEKEIRSYDERFLTKRMIEDISLYEDFADVVIISDARMPLEFEDMKENFDDVTSILVINNFAPSKLTIKEQSDITERALENYDEFDYIIANDDLAKKKEKVFKMLEELK